jgi:hypothetical protein
MSNLKKLKPSLEATGDHTSFLEDIFGRIQKYATYIKNTLNPTGFDEIKHVDLLGDEHYNKVTCEFISTPHVHEKITVGGVRIANDDEIPKRNKTKNDGKS